LILDSIQAVHHPEIPQGPGSITQVRDCTALLERVAQETETTLLLVGHVTKDGVLAGPKTLEHLVDTVLSFEGDRYQHLRTLRAAKNRNGSTGEIGLFEMTEKGLMEVTNPSALFMGGEQASPGRAVVPLMEGERPLLVEIQALVTPSSYTNPLRRFTGIDLSQAGLLIAVIEKTLNLNLSKQDIFLKVTGGLVLKETACDLGILLAIVSSFLLREIPKGVAFLGEVGLGGEVRPVRALDSRIRECARLGLNTLMVPQQKRRENPMGLTLKEVTTLQEATQIITKGLK